MKPSYFPIAPSFRDPAGFIFRHETEIFRAISFSGREDYDKFMASGLFESLVKNGLLVDHEESDQLVLDADTYKIIKPDQIKFISYPYEWSFSQLKHAAMLTLTVQREAMKFGMTLKDASAFNIQFQDARPVFIDTLSFTSLVEGEPWLPYQQFCRHFLAPLLLMAKTDVSLSRLSSSFIDGVTLPLASKLLPKRSWLNIGILLHIHIHARMQRAYSRAKPRGERKTLGKNALTGLIDSLESTVNNIQFQLPNTEWRDYYDNTNYTDSSTLQKHQIVADFLEDIDPKTVWDIGANNGAFSRIAAKRGISTVAFDVDEAAVEINYLNVVEHEETNMLPLVLDVLNPTPAIGWGLKERNSILERGKPDCVMALALIHHLAISGNVPLGHIAQFFASLSANLIIEFVPKEDSQVQKLLQSRADIFPNYTFDGFKSAFGAYFVIKKHRQIGQSSREVYLMCRKDK